MESQLEQASRALFPSSGNRAGNIKFYSGRNRDVTAEQLAEQFNRADAQIRTGESVRVMDVDAEDAS